MFVPIIWSIGRNVAIAQQIPQPDAILLDVMMPEMDGLMTFQKLQTHASTQTVPTFPITRRRQSRTPNK
jgi:CheY-like chemotaxis protein